jgi:Ca2+-binding EF-hand superfamily protein
VFLVWFIQVGDNVRELQFRSPGESTARPAIGRLQAAFEEAGEEGVKALLRSLEALDKSNSGWMDRHELRRVLKGKVRVDLSPEELEEIAKFAGWESRTSANWRDLVSLALDG